METLTSSVETQVEGEGQKITSKGKGKLKEEMTKLPSDTFVEVLLN
jgi:hypothetical protein